MARLKRMFSPFRRLYWRLAFSYMLVTVAVLTVIQILIVVLSVLLLSRTTLMLAEVEREVARLAVKAQSFLASPSPESAALTTWLQEQIPPRARGGAYTFFQVTLPDGQFPSDPHSLTDGDLAIVLDASGKAVAANVPEIVARMAADEVFVDPLVPLESQRVIEQALRGEPSSITLGDRSILVAHPILARGNSPDVIGVLYVRMVSLVPVASQMVLSGLRLLGCGVPLFAILGGTIGIVFGFFTARAFTCRLSALTVVADAWGQGDFSAIAQDHSADEIGQLARQMNRMAKRVQDQLRTHEQLATLEARNQLARDLHDSVKQQVFAVTMTLGAAKTLRERDPEAAWSGVSKALDLSVAAQQELAAMVRELRPVALEDGGLAKALREQVERWSSHTGITVECHVQDERSLAPDVEEALFRVAQEALANVARHSDAACVHVTLSYGGDAVTLTIADDGCGFDAASVQGKGLGLRSMQERVEAIGGTWRAERLDRGTRIEARVPIEIAALDVHREKLHD
jgi:NarL family two-component system sensor histidine kinase LiaS